MGSSALRKPLTWVLMLALAASLLVALGGTSYAVTRRINGVGQSWQPAFRRITVGDRIVWKAVSNPHTVTSYRRPSGKRGKRWHKNASISQGQSTSKRFNKPGLYRFKCLIHSGMTGSVKVVRG